MASSRARSRRADRPSLGQRVRGMLGFDALWTVVAMVAIVVITAPQIGFSEPDYEPGDIAASEVTAPIAFLVADPLSPEARLTAAYQSVPDVYNYTPLAHEYGKGIIRRLFTWGRANVLDAGIVWEDLDAEARFDLGQDAMAAVGHPLPAELIGALAM